MPRSPRRGGVQSKARRENDETGEECNASYAGELVILAGEGDQYLVVISRATHYSFLKV
jgi:hypothetical protein